MDVTVEAAPRVPGFEVGALLGRGSTGSVWEGVRRADGRRVALKIVGADPEAADAAAREAAVSARVAAEHVLAVEACVPLEDGGCALVMPVLRGGDLARLVAARGHLSPGEVVTVLAPLASALGLLHAAGVVHGDVSAGNVLLDLDGRPVLADLGLGRVLGEKPIAVWGTEGHLAPEVLLGSDPSPASDVYALGALGWLCLTGEVPGAPGLRPSLAEGNLAGEGSAPLVRAIESAVDPRPETRPAADELAWQLFAAAQAEPLHLVAGEDEISAVTYRLRAAASPAGLAPRGEAPEPGRSAPAVVTGALAGLGVLLRGLLRPPWRGRAGRRSQRRGAGARGHRLLPVALALAVATGLAGAALAWAAGEGPWSTLTEDIRDPAVPQRQAPATAAIPEAVSDGGGPRPTGSDPRADATAPTTRAAELLGVLAAERAAAWRSADPRRLRGAEVPGGPLNLRDVSAVEALADAGVRYTGLSYQVADVATVSSTRSSAVLRARISTGPYEITGAGGSTARTARRGEEVLVDLALTSQGWRISDLRPSGPPQ